MQPDNAANSLNFRDCGGYACGNHSRMKTGMLYRSASLDHVRGRQLGMVQAANLQTIIDLRPGSERAKRIVELPGVRRITIPLDVDRITRERLMPYFRRKKSNDGMVGAIVSVYRDIVTLTAPSVRILFEHLTDPGTFPLCINCRAGKDRTGYAVAIILRSLGVADRDIVADFLATNRNLLPRVRRLTVPLRILSAGLLPMRVLEAALTAHEAALQASFDVIDTTYGGTDKFLDFCGVDGKMRSRVRELLLEQQKTPTDTQAGVV